MAGSRFVIRSLWLCGGPVLLGCHDHGHSTAATTAKTGSSALIPVAIEEVEIAILTCNTDMTILPLVVRKKLRELAPPARAHSSVDADELSWINEPLRINVPRTGQSALQLFIDRQSVPPMGFLQWVLFLHDPQSDETTTNPVIVDDRLLGEKGIHPRLADLDRDGSYEIVYRDFQHNGTVTNTEQMVFLAIGEDLSLTEILRIDTSDVDIFSKGEWGAIRSRLMSTPGGADHSLVLESWRENPRFGNAREELPSIRLERDPRTGTWGGHRAPGYR